MNKLVAYILACRGVSIQPLPPPVVIDRRWFNMEARK